MQLKNSPTLPALANEVLAVSGSDEDLRRLRATFEGSSWELRTAQTVAAARASLRANRTPVVLCASHLPDGDWKTLLQLTDELAHRPKLIVFSRNADDRLWSEVLNSGGFDVLPFPADRMEIFRSVSSAWRNWRDCAAEHTSKAVAVHSL